MSIYGTSPIKRQRHTKAEIEDLDAALQEIVEQFRPVTVRQVFYQAVSRGRVPKSETKGYRIVQRRLVVLRESGEIPYGYVVDGTRYVHGHTRYNDLDEFTSYAAGLYRKDYWASSEVNAEVWPYWRPWRFGTTRKRAPATSSASLPGMYWPTRYSRRSAPRARTA